MPGVNGKTKRNKKRSRAITEIVKVIGREFWESLPISKKNKRIELFLSNEKSETKKGRTSMKDINREYKGLYAA